MDYYEFIKESFPVGCEIYFNKNDIGYVIDKDLVYTFCSNNKIIPLFEARENRISYRFAFRIIKIYKEKLNLRNIFRKRKIEGVRFLCISDTEGRSYDE